MKFRQQYSIKQKQLVLAFLTTHTHKQTSLHYGIHISMVYKWNYSRDKIASTKLSSIKSGSGRKSFYPVIEKQIHEEALQSRSQGICVTLVGIAQNMRLAIKDILPLSTFKASSGWIKGYKKRNPCKLRVPTVMILGGYYCD